MNQNYDITKLLEQISIEGPDSAEIFLHELDDRLVSDQMANLQACGKLLIPYGTAGFRERAHLLSLVSLRLGIFLGQYAKQQPNKVIGVQISASHNGYEDNGLKVTNWEGGMFDSQLEQLLQNYCNEDSLEKAQSRFKEHFPHQVTNEGGRIHLGWDTRPSCPLLRSLIKAGIAYTQSAVLEIGQVTTPQLHFSVWAHNVQELESDSFSELYVDYFVDQFLALYTKPTKPQYVVMDCADGVGAQWMKIVSSRLTEYFNLRIINGECEDVTQLNHQCGSEFTQKVKQFPRGLAEKLLADQETLCVSIDGDADRIVFFLANQQSQDITLIDGDRFSCLFAMVIKRMLSNIQASITQLNKEPDFYLADCTKEWTIGIVQTAYANGASTTYMREQLKMQTCYEPTGVKYVHKRAHGFDVGIYFEANGHGTVLKSKKFQDSLESMTQALTSVTEYFPTAKTLLDEVQKLDLFISLANQAVGDSISNFLLTQVALQYLSMTPQEWVLLYKDYPSKTTKVYVTHKEVVKTNYEEDRVVAPLGMQARIDALLVSSQYRCFIRASGTEDVIRVYAEGPDVAMVEQLSMQVEQMIRNDALINQT